MKKLMTSTAVLAFAAMPVLAQSTGDGGMFYGNEAASAGTDLAASSLIGMRIYSADAAPSEEDGVLEISDTWEDIGEVGEIIVSRDGAVQAVVLDIGGFLGIGEKHVALSMDQIKFVNDADDAGDYFLVVEGVREDFENAPEFDMTRIGQWAEATAEETASAAEETVAETEEAVETAAAETEAAAENAAAETEAMVENAAQETEQAVETAAAETEAMAENAAQATEQAVETAAAETEAAAETAAAETEDMAGTAAEKIGETADAAERNITALTAPKVVREGWTTAQAGDLTTEELTGARLYDTNDEMIGEVSKLIIDDSGQITDAVLDVGGFLGLGEHSVEVKMDSIQIQRADIDGALRVYVDATKEELEQLPEYSEDG